MLSVRSMMLASLYTRWLQLVAGGTIKTASMLTMNGRQKTFSLALSRDMIPNARIVVFCLLLSGEVLADSLSFHVDGINNHGVSNSLWSPVQAGSKNAKPLFSQLTTASHHYKTSFDMAIVEIHAVVS